MSTTLIKGGTLVTMNDNRQVFRGDLRIAKGRIVEMSPALPAQANDDVVDARDCWVIPGLIQTHVHLVQTLFRGFADDLELLDWLTQKIWPFEKAHSEHSIRVSAQMGLIEMQLSGTTSVLDMGTVRLHEVIFAEALHSGMRYWGGNCLMDMKSTSGPLHRERQDSLNYSEKLIQTWHRRTPLIEYAISPRFVISCTDRLLRAAHALQEKYGLLLHTHASENKGEVALVKRRTGCNNVEFLNKMGCLNARSVIAHGIHLSAKEVRLMAKTGAGLAHCPSSNLKLASGVAPITEYLRQGLKVGLGADGAPCNNSMDAFLEMRLAALLQKPLFGPTALPAEQAFALATVGGAKVLNASERIGSLVIGKEADVAVVSRQHIGVATVSDPYSALVYSCTGRDVRDVWIAGRPIVRNHLHQIYDVEKVRAEALQLTKAFAI